MKQFSKILAALMFIFACVNLNAQDGADPNVFITNEASINSEYLEYSPAFFEDGIIFISSRVANKRYKIRDNRIGKNIMSIFYAKRTESGPLQDPQPFSEELLSTVHEGPMALDRTADNIFFTRNNIKKGKVKKSKKDGIVKLKIYSSEKVGDKWGNIKDLPFNNDDYNTAHPSVSVEGKYLYFASDRPGGMGGMDIWRCMRIGDDWGDPENLGPIVNTDSDEIFPFIHADGTLYFASSGHSGFGGLDLYTSKESSEQWADVQNLGKPFNTASDDFGFILDRDKKNGYFSSSRDGGLGEDDIYSFYLLNNLDQITGTDTSPKGTRSIKISVIDDETGMPLPGVAVNYILVDELTLARALVDNQGNEVDPTTNELLLKLPFGDGATRGVTDADGNYPADVNFSNYIFNIERDGYQARQVILTNTSEVNDFLVTLSKASPIVTNNTTTVNTTPPPATDPLVIGDNGSGIDFGASIREGSIIELPNIYYNFNDASIRPDAKIDLDVVVGLMNRYPDMEIELASHTDSRGSTRYNRSLSQNRAQRAVDYLIRNGIASSRLRPTGYGESELRNQCGDDVSCSEAEHQYNRRTEVRVTRMSREVNVTFVNDTSAPETVDYAGSNFQSSQPSTPTTTNVSPSTNTSGVSGDGGSVKVIVGIFKNLRNAQKRLNQVIALGFDKAEIDLRSDSHMVIAGRYSSRDSAKDAADFLNQNSVKTYIKN